MKNKLLIISSCLLINFINAMNNNTEPIITETQIIISRKSTMGQFASALFNSKIQHYRINYDTFAPADKNTPKIKQTNLTKLQGYFTDTSSIPENNSEYAVHHGLNAITEQHQDHLNIVETNKKLEVKKQGHEKEIKSLQEAKEILQKELEKYKTNINSATILSGNNSGEEISSNVKIPNATPVFESTFTQRAAGLAAILQHQLKNIDLTAKTQQEKEELITNLKSMQQFCEGYVSEDYEAEYEKMQLTFYSLYRDEITSQLADMKKTSKKEIKKLKDEQTNLNLQHDTQIKQLEDDKRLLNEQLTNKNEAPKILPLKQNSNLILKILGGTALFAGGFAIKHFQKPVLHILSWPFGKK